MCRGLTPVDSAFVPGYGYANYFRFGVEHEQYVWRFPKIHSQTDEESFWRKMLLEGTNVHADECRNTWAATAVLLIEDAVFEIGNNILKRASNNLYSYVQFLLTQHTVNQVLVYVRMLEKHFVATKSTHPTFLKIL